MNICKELLNLCEVLRVDNDPVDAVTVDRRQRHELAQLLQSLPPDDQSIAGAEGAAYYFESTGNIPQAIRSWKSLLAKLTYLRKDVREHNYSEEVRRVLLEHCEDAQIERCLLSITRLERQAAADGLNVS